MHGNVQLFLVKTKFSAFFKLKPPDSTLSVSLGGSACLHKPPLLRYTHPFLFITQPFRTDTDKTRLPADQLFWRSHRQPASPLAWTYGWSPRPLFVCVSVRAWHHRRGDACHRAPFRQSADESSPEGVCPPEEAIINMTARGEGMVKSEAVEEKS